jgi:hypothetical protein
MNTAPTSTPAPAQRFGHDLDQPEPPRQRRQFVRPALKAVWQFLKYMVLLPVTLVRGRRSKLEEVTVYSAHPSFFLWMLIVIGFVTAAVVRHNPNAASFCGWLYVWALLYFLVTLLYDFSTRKLALWALIFALIWITSNYFEQVRHLLILGPIFSYLRSLDPKLDPGTVTVLSWLLLLPWIGALLHMALNGRKRFTPNEIGEFHFGEGSELTDRTGLRFRTRYRDILETVLTFGGGDLIAVDNHQNEIKRWDNIIGLFFFWNELDRVLHQRAAVMDIPDAGTAQEAPVA